MVNLQFLSSKFALPWLRLDRDALFKDRVRPAIEARRQELEAMYDLVLGRPEIDPVLLTGVTILQTWNRVWKPCVAPVTVTVR